MFKNPTTVLGRYLLFLVLILFSAYAQNPGDYVFAGIKVYDVKIYFSQPNYWDSLLFYYHQGLEQYIPATVKIENNTFSNVGVRLKGNSSFNHPNNKKSFKLSFDEFVSGQKWDNLKSVSFNNMWGDPSFMREKIHLDFLKDCGLHAPRGNFARLYINDTLWAFYSMVESVDKTFLTTHYNNKSGDMFKAVDAIADTGVGSELVSDFVWYGNADTNYYSRYELKTDGSTTAWPALLALIDSINNNPNVVSAFSSMINLSSVYKAFSADVLFGNLDAYISSGRNFYIYFLPSTKKMEWIIWDVGLSFGAFQKGVSNPETMSILIGQNYTDRPLLTKIVKNDSLKLAYLLTMSSLLNSHFTTANLYPHIDSVANIIRPYVIEDPRKMYTALQFEQNINSDINAAGGLGNRKPGLKSFINSRINSVKSQLANLGITSVSDAVISPVDCALQQNYPNPFNPETKIAYTIGKKGFYKMELYNSIGHRIKTLFEAEFSPGDYSFSLNLSGYPGGVYFYRIYSDKFTSVKKMIFLK